MIDYDQEREVAVVVAGVVLAATATGEAEGCVRVGVSMPHVGLIDTVIQKDHVFATAAEAFAYLDSQREEAAEPTKPSTDPLSLYKVKLSVEVPVLACDRTEAEGAALAAAERGEFPVVLESASYTHKIHFAHELPEGWEDHEPPGGYAKGKTCAELIKLLNADGEVTL